MNKYNNLFGIELSKIGAYTDYVRKHSHQLLDYVDYLIQHNKQIKRDFELSIILDDRIHPIYEERNKISKIVECLDNINIFTIDETETQNIEKMGLEMDSVYKYIEYLTSNKPL